MPPDGAPLILVVDDEPMVRQFMTAVLRDSYRVLRAADGCEALALFSAVGSEIRAVVTDVQMPNMDGQALAQALRRFHWPPPILFVSGHGNGAGELQGPVLKKPFPPQALLDAVQDMLGTSAQRARR